jgi:hypothetical protein
MAEARSRRGGSRVRAPGGFEESEHVLRDGVWVPRIRRTLPWRELSLGWTCDHRWMRYCCRRRCGHLVCRCGLAWDEEAQK